jgi:hypothetical protein
MADTNFTLPHPLVLFELMSNIRPSGRSECWPWVGAIHKDGHGQYDGFPAHRMVYQALYGPLPDDVVVRHTCDNPPCCNPRHLITGSHADNVADRVARDRSAKGQRNGRAKLTEQQAKEIIASPHTHAYLAMVYNVSRDTVKKIRAGKLWKHLERQPKIAA